MLEFHEAANLFPLHEETLDDLAADIRQHGQQVPIETLDGKILDGRRRYLACDRAGIKPKYRPVTADDPIAYVLSLNLHRRHLSLAQLAMVGARARQYYEEEAKKRMSAGGGDKKSKNAKSGAVNLPEPIATGDARDLAGLAVGVSGKTIDLATRVLEKGTPKLIAAVEADHIAVSTASRASSLSEAEQDAVAERAADATKKGYKKRPRPASNHTDEEPEVENREIKGVGIIRANEAINSLTRIPKNDALRKRGFQLVMDWIRHNS